MILPTKGIPTHRALLSVAFQVLEATKRETVTIGQGYQQLLELREKLGLTTPLTFEWYVLSLDVLYALDLVQLTGQILSFETQHAAAA
jgi:hypothetical protein